MFVVARQREKRLVGVNDLMAWGLCVGEDHRHSRGVSGRDEWTERFPEGINFAFSMFLLARFEEIFRHDKI